MHWVIYSLCEPGTGQVRYVGWTSNLPRRTREHLSPKANDHSYKARWIRKLKSSGLNPGIRILEEGDEQGREEAERRWIAFYRTPNSGGLLTNITDGGDGAVGHVKSEETRRKLSEALKGKPRPREVVERWLRTKMLRGPSEKQVAAIRAVSARNIGRVQPREAVEVRANMLRGKSWGSQPQSVREVVSVRFKGIPKSVEQRAKMSAAKIGSRLSEATKQKISETKRNKCKDHCSVQITQ